MPAVLVLLLGSVRVRVSAHGVSPAAVGDSGLLVTAGACGVQRADPAGLLAQDDLTKKFPFPEMANSHAPQQDTAELAAHPQQH